MRIFNNKTYLVTGGTGSFGSTMIKDLLKKKEVKEIRIFSRDENKQEKLRVELNSKKLKFYIGDVRDFNSIKKATEGVNYVFHAAALKQVPSCEFYPMEAVQTNIIGTRNVIEACKYSKVEKAIFLSTDKAVYPVNAMGMTKALMEKVILSYSKDSKVNFCITRYGNVMGSRGSVIPLFINQIKNNQNITITNFKMSRFLMSLTDTVNLVYEALSNGKNGDIFVQKSPSTTIENLAKSLLKIFKKTNKFKNIGVRHGERLYEILISKEEMLRTVVKKNFFIIKPDNKDQNFAKYFTKGHKNLNKIREYNSLNTKELNLKETIFLLKNQIANEENKF
jgi:FlaA1/EpsC-like NDP-sugar epimerase